jgi:transcriptional regulator EpsA
MQAAAPPPDELYGSTLLSAGQVRALVQAAEGALALSHSAQFFVWTQGSLQLLLPHQLACCGSYRRSSGALCFELFNSVPLPALAAQALTQVLAQRVQDLWLQARCRPVLVATSQLGAEGAQLAQAGFEHVLAHGVSRPQRPNEIESFFMLAHRQRYGESHRMLLDLLMPQLHSAWLRAQAVPPLVLPLVPRSVLARELTERERQVLRGLGEGRSNQQIAQALEISALTVKNHVQRILRKLGVSNRAHAVARAMGLRLLERP